MNPLNIIRTIAAAASIVVVGVAIKDHNHIVKTERAKREEIARNTERSILAIRRASQIVEAKIHNGDYDGNIFAAIPAIQSDQKFFELVDRIND